MVKNAYKYKRRLPKSWNGDARVATTHEVAQLIAERSGQPVASVRRMLQAQAQVYGHLWEQGISVFLDGLGWLCPYEATPEVYAESFRGAANKGHIRLRFRYHSVMFIKSESLIHQLNGKVAGRNRDGRYSMVYNADDESLGGTLALYRVPPVELVEPQPGSTHPAESPVWEEMTKLWQELHADARRDSE